jgi:uncharacterized protein DUF3105
VRASERSIARCRAGGAEARVGRALAFAALVTLVGACGRMKGPDDGPPGSAGSSGAAGLSGGAGLSGVGGASGGAGPDAGGLAGAAADADVGETITIDGGALEGGAACTAVVAQHPNEGALHVDCLPVPKYGTRPPSSGNHYPIWADYKTYTTPVPWGHLVHDLEHGAIVIVYSCAATDAACAAEIARAQAMIDGLPFPLDPVDVDVADGYECVAPTKHRVILAPDPTLDVRWAASAWTWTLRATCFDETTFSDFAKAHYAQGGENFCVELHEPFCDVQ